MTIDNIKTIENGRLPFDKFTAAQLKEALPYWSISAFELEIIFAIALRAHQCCAEMKARSKRDDLLDPDRHLIAMDYASVHLTRGLRLSEMLQADVFRFVQDFVSITKNIDRKTGTLKSDVHLHFQREK